MNEGLEALKDLYAKLSIKSSIDDISENLEEYHIIEKELKEGEKVKEVLDIFKNALTIEHDLSTPSFTPLEKDKSFDVNEIITETIKIKQNDLDEKLRKLLREWVLKNAFPEELKAVEIIKKKLPPLMRSALLDYCNKEEYDILKEVLNYGK